MKVIKIPALVLFAAMVLLAACQKVRPIFVSVIPTQDGVEMNYVGYVTDGQFNLVSQLHPFTRKYAGTTYFQNRTVHLFISENDTTPFYTDEDGSVWQYAKENLSARVTQYNLTAKEPVEIAYWEPLLQQKDGLETRWQIQVDTTFEATDEKGNINQIRYLRVGKAKYDGWTNVTVPERRDQPYRALAATWSEINQYLINVTSGDTLFAMEGTARQFFEPTLGSIRYMTDFTLKEIGKDPVFRRGTWDLTKKSIPEPKPKS